MKNISEQASKKIYIARINRVTDYIKNNLDGDCSLQNLAKIAAFSKFYFHRVFKGVLNENLNQYVNRIRIESSAFSLLHHSNKSITAIAYDSGFSSPAVYSRAFRAHYKMTPSEWRVSGNSNNCKVIDNIDKTMRNTSKLTSQVSLYIDPHTKQPAWKINMTDQLQFEVKVLNMPEIDIAYIRHHGEYQPNDKVLFQGLFSKLLAWAVPRNLFNPPTTKVMTVYSCGYPSVTEPENLAVDVCISISKDVVVEGEVGKRVMPSGQYAMVRLTEVTVEVCAKIWDEIFHHWLPASGYQPGDGSYYCLHLNDPEQHPEKLHSVEMYLPVKAL